MTPQRALAALALIFALAHIPFLAHSLEDIDSVNFALGVRDFNVAEHRPHPPGYPLYIAMGKVMTAVTGTMMNDAPASSIEARALAALSLIAGVAALVFLYGVFSSLGSRTPEASPWSTLNVEALAATAVTASCPLFWYLAARPMSDLPGLAFALAAQACLLLAWQRQSPGPGGDRRLSPAVTAASGRMIVIGSLLAALSIGMRSQTVWFTLPLLAVVLLDRVGRGVAGAMIGGGIMFIVGGLAWGIPLLVVSGGLGPYLAALGTQAGEDFMSGEMLYTNPSPRAAAFALMRTFLDPWDSVWLGAVVIVLAAAGLVHLLMRDRRTLAAVLAMSAPYLLFHLAFQDTSFVRYALPIVPAVAFLAMRGAALATERGVMAAAVALSIGSVAIASPVLAAYGAEVSPTVRALGAMQVETLNRDSRVVLGMHQTFKRPLEAEDLTFATVLPSPPRLEWLELARFWREGASTPLWFLADPARSDLALIDPASLADSTEFRWPLVARPAFGGMRPSAARWYRIPPPGWFAEEGWSLTPETSGMSGLMGRAPHLGPISAYVRRRPGPVTVMVGGRNLSGANDPAARFTMAIDGATVQQWEAAPGFFLHVFEIPADRLAGEGPLAHLTIQSTAVSGAAVIQTAIEQFNLQAPEALMWGYGDGWNENESNPTLGVWRWTSERSVLRVIGPPQDIRVSLVVESPLRYFDAPANVRVKAGDREIAATALGETQTWSFDVRGDALAAAGGLLTLETDKTFVPAERGGGADNRRLGLRILAIRVANSLTQAEVSR